MSMYIASICAKFGLVQMSVLSGSKIVIISTLINQLLSYASVRDVIEESMDQSKSLSYELKQLQWAEIRREREEIQYQNKRKLEHKLVINQQT